MGLRNATPGLNTNKEKWWVLSLASQNPSLSGLQGKGRGQASGDHTIPLLTHLHKEPQEKKKILSSKKSLLWPLSYSRKQTTKPTAGS